METKQKKEDKKGAKKKLEKKEAEEVKDKKLRKKAPVRTRIEAKKEETEKGNQEKTEKNEEGQAGKTNKYYEATGGRKTSSARVRLFTQGKKEIIINGKPYKEYFPLQSLQDVVLEALKKINSLDKFRFTIKVRGGGISSQAEACRHGIAKTLVLLNPYFRKRLKKAGLLTRDPRMRERKKFGLKRARKAPQWSKR